MAESFGTELTIVQATADTWDRSIELWVAFAKPNQAVALIRSEVPEGWTVELLKATPTPALRQELRNLRLDPGEVRKLTG